MEHPGLWREAANQAVELELLVLVQGPQVLAQVRLQALNGGRAGEVEDNAGEGTKAEGRQGGQCLAAPEETGIHPVGPPPVESLTHACASRTTVADVV